MELLGSCTAEFIPSAKVPGKKRDKKPLPVGLSFHGNAGDVDMLDPSFYQQFYQCDWQNDLDNQNLMDRRFSNRGRIELTERPEYHNCEPTSINLERRGDVTDISVDNKPDNTENLKNIGDESVLKGLWGAHSDCKINREIGPKCISDDDKYCRKPNKDLDNYFEDYMVNDEFFNKQLNINCENSLTIPSIFRNYTSMKLQNP